MPIEVRYDMPAAGIGQAAAYGGGAQATMQAAQMLMQQNAAAMQARSHQDDLNARYEEMYLHSADAAAERNARADIASQASGREERVAARQEERDNRLQQGRMDLQDSRFGYRSDLEDQRAGNQAYLSDYRLNARQQAEADSIAQSERNIEREYQTGGMTDTAYRNAMQANQARRLGLTGGATRSSSGSGGGGGGVGLLNRGSGQDEPSPEELQGMRERGLEPGPTPGTYWLRQTGELMERGDNGSLRVVTRGPRQQSLQEYQSAFNSTAQRMASNLPPGQNVDPAKVEEEMRRMSEAHLAQQQEAVQETVSPSGTAARPHRDYNAAAIQSARQDINSAVPEGERAAVTQQLDKLNDLLVRRGTYENMTPSQRREALPIIERIRTIAENAQRERAREFERMNEEMNRRLEEANAPPAPQAPPQAPPAPPQAPERQRSTLQGGTPTGQGAGAGRPFVNYTRSTPNPEPIHHTIGNFLGRLLNDVLGSDDPRRPLR